MVLHITKKILIRVMARTKRAKALRSASAAPAKKAEPKKKEDELSLSYKEAEAAMKKSEPMPKRSADAKGPKAGTKKSGGGRGGSVHGVRRLFWKYKKVGAAIAARKNQGQMENFPYGGQFPFVFTNASGAQIPVQFIEKKEEGKKPEEKSVHGVDIKNVFPSGRFSKKGNEKEELERLNVSYPLTPPSPKAGEKIYAWCNVKFHRDDGTLVYHVVEPPLTEQDKAEIKRIKDIIEEKIDIRFEAIESGSSVDYLRHAIDDIIRQFGISLTVEQKLNYEYYILRDFVGLGKLQPLLNDQNIEDISCDGANIPIFVYHKDPKLASMRTNVIFENRDELNDFVMKVAQRCGKAVSVAEPILEGALPDGSRVQAILETDIARRGSNITVRKFSKEPITPVHLLNFNSIDPHLLAYLWYLIEHRRSILVSGPTASGKTSLLNALSLFIHPSMKVVSIEDTPELRLPHAHWVPEIAREGFGTGENKIGEVSLFDLLKGALRQRPDYIIVGEVRGQEAYILFQAMATGHAGLATIHADSIEKVVDRLTTPPISLPASLIETLDVIVFIKRTRRGNSYVRKVFEVHEVVGYDFEKKQPKTKKVFKWTPSTDKFEVVAESEVLGSLSEDEGISESEIKSELFSRQKMLEWLKEKGISGYKEVGSIISDYYNDREGVMDVVTQ